jgi:hypothetical protein
MACVRLGAVQSLSGSSLTTSYTASAPIHIGNARRIVFDCEFVRAATSPANTTTIKLQARYNDGSVTTSYLDLPSALRDVIGAAQPKAHTFEIEHAISTPSHVVLGTITTACFVLTRPLALVDVTVNIKADTQGITGDTSIVYATAYQD